jgi:hypothetical protein
MTWGFWRAYCDEAYALLSQDFLSANATPDGVQLATLEADLPQI